MLRISLVSKKKRIRPIQIIRKTHQKLENCMLLVTDKKLRKKICALRMNEQIVYAVRGRAKDLVRIILLSFLKKKVVYSCVYLMMKRTKSYLFFMSFLHSNSL
ncbi:hypothetical protein CG428_01070 [Pantoea ananatis]|nr:hypothetical protein CG428_01070 [Pantoea ananatis]